MAAPAAWLPDIVTVEQAQALFSATRTLRYKVFVTLYSLGLCLGEGLALRVGGIDAARSRVHIRDAKGNRLRLVPLPAQPRCRCCAAFGPRTATLS